MVEMTVLVTWMDRANSARLLSAIVDGDALVV